MNSAQKTVAIAFPIIFVMMVIYTVIVTYSDRKANLNVAFKGRVSAVRYCDKGFPYVTVKGHEYYLSSGYDFNYAIKQGDSISKENGSNVYKLYKSGTGKELSFTN